MAFLDNKEIGNRLKEKRKETNLSARQFAIKAGIDQSQYTKIEKGELPITENIMEKLTEVHGLDKDSILHGINVPRETNNHSTGLNKPQHAPDSELMRKYVAILERENSTLISQLETNLKKMEELKDIVSQNFALLSSLRYAAALILLNQRKGLIRDLSRKEVSDLVVIAGILDKVVADALNLSPNMDKIPESIR